MTDKKQKHARAVGLLRDFGLSENEAAIYTYLLERGKSVGGSSIAAGAGIHRQYVYVGLKCLVELALVEVIPRGKQSRYQAVAPSQIGRIARRRLLEAEETVRELNTFSAIGHEQDFEVLQGRDAIVHAELDYAEQAQEGATEYVIGGDPTGFAAVMGDVLDEYTAIKDEKGMQVLYLGGKAEELTRYEEQTSFKPRLLPQLPAGQTHMAIRSDSVVFFSFLKPPLAYVIKSPVVAADYKNFFMMLWEMGEEV